MEKYSDEQVEFYRERWDSQGTHLSRNETIERMEAAGIESEESEKENVRGTSVVVQFAEILEKRAKWTRANENYLLMAIKADGFSSIFEDQIHVIVRSCKDEELLDQDGRWAVDGREWCKE